MSVREYPRFSRDLISSVLAPEATIVVIWPRLKYSPARDSRSFFSQSLSPRSLVTFSAGSRVISGELLAGLTVIFLSINSDYIVLRIAYVIVRRRLLRQEMYGPRWVKFIYSGRG